MSEVVHSDPTPGHPEWSESCAQRALRGAGGSPPTVRALWVQANRVCHLIFAFLREVFDESAYTRFLDRHKLEPSRSTYAAFRREHEHSNACRVRCC